MKKYFFLSLMFLNFIFCNVSFVKAGECIDGLEYYYLKILKPQKVSKNDLAYAISCFSHSIYYYEMGYEHFASPTAMDKIKKYNSRYKDDLYKLLPQYLSSNDKMLKCSTAITLAYFEYKDAYNTLRNECTESPSSTVKALLFGILKAEESIPWIIEQYKKIDHKYKSKPIFSYGAKMNYLNALYHIKSKKALPFIREVIQNPRPEKILKTAIKVKERILE